MQQCIAEFRLYLPFFFFLLLKILFSSSFSPFHFLTLHACFRLLRQTETVRSPKWSPGAERGPTSAGLATTGAFGAV